MSHLPSALPAESLKEIAERVAIFRVPGRLDASVRLPNAPGALISPSSVLSVKQVREGGDEGEWRRGEGGNVGREKGGGIRAPQDYACMKVERKRMHMTSLDLFLAFVLALPLALILAISYYPSHFFSRSLALSPFLWFPFILPVLACSFMLASTRAREFRSPCELSLARAL